MCITFSKHGYEKRCRNGISFRLESLVLTEHDEKSLNIDINHDNDNDDQVSPLNGMPLLPVILSAQRKSSFCLSDDVCHASSLSSVHLFSSHLKEMDLFFRHHHGRRHYPNDNGSVIKM